MEPKNWFQGSCSCVWLRLHVKGAAPQQLASIWTLTTCKLISFNQAPVEFVHFGLFLVWFSPRLWFLGLFPLKTGVEKKDGSQMGCNIRAAFSSWVYKNIYKIVSIYDSAWRSGVDVSLKLAAAESFRMVLKFTFIWFWKKLCFTCWKLEQL